MNVDLCYRLKTTEKDKIHVIKDITLKRAVNIFKKNETKIISAYIRHFEGWHYQVIRELKKEEDKNGR